MGIFERIRSWFSRRGRSSSPSPGTSPSPPVEAVDGSGGVVVAAPVTEMDVLVQEHEQLEIERSRLRQEISLVDSKYSAGEMSAADRDRAYRVRLARAGSIRVRQMEIRSRLTQMGYLVPVEWGAVRILR